MPRRSHVLSPKKRLSLIVLVGLACIGAVAWYWLAWRPSTSDYDMATTNLKAATLVTQTFSDKSTTEIKVGNINRTAVNTIGSQSALLRSSLTSVAGSRAVAHDHVTNKVLIDHKKSLTDYMNTVDQFAGSLVIYQNVVESCNDSIISATALSHSSEFNQASQPCRDIIASKASVPDASFNAFYQQYRSAIQTLITSYDAYFKAVDKDTAKDSPEQQAVNDNLKKLTSLNDTIIKLPTFTVPTDSIKALQSSLDSQRDVFFKW